MRLFRDSHFNLPLGRRRALELLGRTTANAGLIAFASASQFARAQAWPSKPLRLVVPFPPGGTTDFVSRLIAAELFKSLGQNIVVENKPGAGTVIGVDNIAKSPGDGYHLVTVANSFCVNQSLIKNLPYNAAKDLRPIALMGQSEHVLAAHPALGMNNLNDLVKLAKQQPGKLSYASFGNGTSAHLSGEMLKAKLGIDLIHVPFKGQAPALADLLGGQVSVMFGNWPEFRGHIQSKKLVALGMATAKRPQYASNIPTLAEQGTAIESVSWNGVLAPATTPDALVQRLNAEINKALQAQAVVDAFQSGAIVSLATTPQGFNEFLKAETEKYGDVIRGAGIKAD